MRKTLAVAFVIYNEPLPIIFRTISLIQSCYKDALESILVINKSPFPISLFPQITASWERPDNSVSNFINLQDLHLLYLEKSKATHLITLDPDTICLRWDQQFYDFAGQYIYYSEEFQKRRQLTMPQRWLQTYPDFTSIGKIRAIQGGWTMKSREVIEKIIPLFYQHQEEWKREAWGGSEQILGYYYQKSGYDLKQYPEVCKANRGKYVTILDPNLSPKKLKKLLHTVNVLHPIKTMQHWNLIQQLLPEELNNLRLVT